VSTQRSSALLPLAALASVIIGAAAGSLATGYFIRHEQPRQAEQSTPTPAVRSYTDHGDGIYGFPSVNEEFTKAVLTFLKEEQHVGLHCHLLADTYGQDSRWTQMVTGHILQCHDTATYAQGETIP
jgi:hypothetical protein